MIRAVFWLVLLFVADAGKILVYSPSISYSHLISNGRIADALAKAGHDVVMFIPEYSASTTKFAAAKHARIVRMNNISSRYDDDLAGGEEWVMAQSTLSFRLRLDFEYTLTEMCRALMARREELEELKNYGFDAAFAEQIDLCGIGVIRYLGIHNLLWISTTPIMDAVSYNLGIPAPPSYVPTIEENDKSDTMTFWQRAHNIYMYIGSIVVHRWGSDMSTQVFREIDPDFPNLREIAANASLCFVNSDEMFDFPRPIIHKNIYIGGLGVGEPKPLDQKFTTLMNKGKRGVIIISLGTIAPFHAFSENIKMGFVGVVRSMPDYHFILKITKDNHHFTITLFTDDTTTQSFFEGVNNCDFVEWLPQSDILAHHRLELFVMHGGVNGLTEAMLRAVPVVVIPIFADQFRNGRNVEKRGVGKVILKQDLAEDTIRAAIQEILSNESYKKNAVRMSKLMREKPFSAEQRLIQWTTFAVENGVLDVLHVQGSRMNSIVYFNLDVIALVVAALFLLTCIVLRLFCVLRRIFIVQKLKQQ
ncbi:UDP-glucoronosyl and UDP-glucosyl transferase [Ancylostoma caninum]|uniref:UDP-glucuronosyltransferase n=1 Tax=Ancylostoma caninum TaxID=29170 RepID=A0A368H2M9_ANCCA|nr:UDP-glucoronosyl and UDP-glucosyl transferase [Ancylostoma caninum]